MIEIDDDLLLKWGTARALANGVSSIQRDLRAHEDSFRNQVEASLKHQYGLNEDERINVITAMRAAIDQAVKAKEKRTADEGRGEPF